MLRLIDYPLEILNRFALNLESKKGTLTAAMGAICTGFFLYPTYANFENFTTDVVVFVQNMESVTCAFLIYARILTATVKHQQLARMIRNIKTMSNNIDNYSVSDQVLAKKILFYQRMYYISLELTILTILVIAHMTNQIPLGYWSLARDLKFKITYWGQFFTLYPFSAILVAFDIFFVGILFNVVIQFKCLQRNFENVDFGERNEQIVFEKLKAHIKTHIKLIEFVNEIRDNISPLLFAVFTGVTVLESLELYMVLEANQTIHMARSLAAASFTFIQLWLYTAVIDTLTSEMENMGFKMYSSNWHSHKMTEYAKVLQIVTIRSQQKTFFNGFGVVIMNSRTVITILKFAWSTYTLLRAYKK